MYRIPTRYGMAFTDEVDEAVELLKRIGASLPEADAREPWEQVNDYLAVPEKAHARMILSLIRERPSTGISVADLKRLMNAKTNNQITGWVSGIHKAAKRAGVDPRQILIRSGEVYKAGRLLLERELPALDEPTSEPASSSVGQSP